MSEPPLDGRDAVRPRPVRISDAIYDQLAVMASLDGISTTAAITKAIETYIETRRSNGDLANRAAAALAEIDREAAARRAAVESLIADPRTGVHPKQTPPVGGGSETASTKEPARPPSGRRGGT